MPPLGVEREEQARRWFLKTALSYLGSPYRWGGDDPSGFDCSGFVIECLKTVGLLSEQEDLTADQLRYRFADRKLKIPVPGSLLFRLRQAEGPAVHVVICLDSYFQIGASGGGSSTTDIRSAWSQNAFVKIRPIREDIELSEILDPLIGYGTSHPTK